MTRRASTPIFFSMAGVWWYVLLVLDGLFLAALVWWVLRPRAAPTSTPAMEPLAPPPPQLEIRFSADRAELSAAAQEVLEEVAQGLCREPRWRLGVEGSADDSGHLTRNRRLSRGRAEAVVRFLSARGVARSRMAVTALEPARGTSEPDRAQLRRATLTWEAAH